LLYSSHPTTAFLPVESLIDTTKLFFVHCYPTSGFSLEGTVFSGCFSLNRYLQVLDSKNDMPGAV